MNTCIIGLGNIGSAIYNGIKSEHIENTTTCDVAEWQNGRWQSLLIEADVNIICLPANNLGANQDMTLINHYLEYLYMNKVTSNGIVIICSTVLPKSINQKYYDDLSIVLFPQFMNERNAVQEFKETDYIVLGSNSIKLARRVQDYIQETFDLQNPKYELTSILYASMYKYIRNLKMTYNVLFWNYIFEMGTDEKNLFDYRKIRDMMKNNPVDEYNNVADDGFWGIGGTCLPKDLKAIDNFFPHELTDTLYEFNSRIRND